MPFRPLWLLLLSAYIALAAQDTSSLLFNGLKWRSIGPFRGGRSVAVSGIRGGGSTFFFGSVDGGIWKTQDAGAVWSPISDASLPVGSIGALEAAPSNPAILFAGTGESDIRSNLASGDGIYKSTDGGNTWVNVGLRDTRQISRVAIDPKDASRVFVAALGHAYGPNEERGVFRTTDGGSTWKKVLFRGPNIGAADVALAPDAPNILLAGMWEAHRPPWSTYAPLGGPGSGLFRSIDGGDSWTQLQSHGLPGGEWGRVGVAIARGTGGKRMYAAIGGKDAGIYRSDDGGDMWTLTNKDPRLTSRDWYFNSITVDPNDPDVLYDPNVALYKLTGGGKTLSIVRGAPGGDDYHQLWIDPANSQHMVLGTDQGTTVTLDGGVTWSTWYNQPTGQFYHVITDNDFPYHVYGSQQDSGTAAIASKTDHGQIDTRDWFTVGGSESGYIAPDPKNPNIIYSSGTYGTVARLDRRTMQSQNIAPWPLSAFGKPMSERKFRDPWTPVLVFSPVQQNALYLGTQFVMRTLDGGLHWKAVSPDLTGAVPEKSKDAAPAVTIDNAKRLGYGVIYTIAPSSLSAAQIWAGSDTGLIHLTRDGGKSWKDVTPPNVGDWSKITHIEASHFRAAEAFAAVDRHRLDDMTPYLYRTRDFGETWQLVVDGIDRHSFFNSIREDPKCRGLLFAGTEFGVYVSFDDGDHWSALQLNLPVSSVRDLAIHDNDLIAATHGRGFWILDDISPLRQISGLVGGNNFFYAPAQAIRVTSDNFSGTPLPPEEPQAQNPARGACIDYYLEKDSASTVVLEIADAQNRLVRRFSTADKPWAPPKDVPIAPRWFQKPPTLGTTAGMHRFVWDLRYGRSGEPGTSANDDDDGPGRWLGPLVMPGTYKLRLTVDGQTLSQPLHVVMDPRSPITPTELTQQFTWSKQAFDDMIRARRAVAEIHGLQAAIGKLGKTQSEKIDAELKSATLQAGRILTGDPGKNDGLEETSRSLTTVLTALQSADRTPPSQVLALYRESSQSLKSGLASWAGYKKRELPALNDKLRAVGSSPLEISRIEEDAEDSLAR